MRKRRIITFKIDELTPCLKDVKTGEIYETEVVRLKRKSFLSKFNKRTGWYVNWSEFPKTVEIYALVLKGTTDIQGLVAISYDEQAKAVYVNWGCTAPHNNIWQYGVQKYSGVGGHLFAIAGELSKRRGYEGFVYGEAMDKDLYAYYINKYNAFPLPPRNNPFCFMLSDEAMNKIMEVYDYDWTEERL